MKYDYYFLNWVIPNTFLLQKQQISIQKTFQFISSINGVSQTYKKAKIFFLFDPVSQHIGWNKRRPTRRHYKAIYFVGLQSQRNTLSSV